MIKMIIREPEDINATKNKKVFDIIGRQAPMSDVAISTGGKVNGIYNIKGDKSLKGRTGVYWTKCRYYNWSGRVIYFNGDELGCDFDKRSVGVRPALKFSSIDDLKNVVSGELEDFQGIKRGKLYVPLYIDKKAQEQLLMLFNDGKLEQLNQSKVTFPTDSNRYYDYGKPFKRKNNSYYKYQDKLYVLLDVNSCYKGKPIQFTNGKYYRDGDKIFAEVVEVYVYFNEEKNENEDYVADFDRILFAGVPFDHTGRYPMDFENSDIGRYLKVYWQELEKLQLVVKEIKDKGQSNLETKPENNVLDTTDSNKHINTTPIEGTEQSAEEIANESTASNTTSIDKIIDYFNYLKEENARLEAKITELKEQLEDINAKKADTTGTIKKVNALIGKGGDGRDE